ncbi:MAG: Asp23/Gls24 family envelope stress response protein [Erysipelotrichaceae bacterium]|nr:Asp23/Gls24 family envelope stress response protein [Erysipelotrichaceae bacterium]
MVINQETPNGKIKITIDAIATVAAETALGCYGVVGLTHKESGHEIDLLEKEDYAKGVFVRNTSNGYVVDIYIILAYGVKITEIAAEVQKRVKYVLEKTFDIRFYATNVYVHGIKLM